MDRHFRKKPQGGKKLIEINNSLQAQHLLAIINKIK